jgi:hypothetical protein
MDGLEDAWGRAERGMGEGDPDEAGAVRRAVGDRAYRAGLELGVVAA